LSRKDVRREENIPAQQPAAQAHARLPGPHAHPSRSRGAVAAEAQGAQAAQRLTGASRPPGAGRGEPLRRGQRIRRRGDYLRAYRRGRRRSGALLTLHFIPNEEGVARLGVTVSRKVGNSVVRHRLKRRLVEGFRRSDLRPGLPAWDFVAHLRPEAATADFASLRDELESLLRAAAEGRR
jgi:ribonuclease P protein component